MLRYATAIRKRHAEQKQIPVSVYLVLSPVRAVRIDEEGACSITTNPPMVNRLPSGDVRLMEIVT